MDRDSPASRNGLGSSLAQSRSAAAARGAQPTPQLHLRHGLEGTTGGTLAVPAYVLEGHSHLVAAISRSEHEVHPSFVVGPLLLLCRSVPHESVCVSEVSQFRMSLIWQEVESSDRTVEHNAIAEAARVKEAC